MYVMEGQGLFKKAKEKSGKLESPCNIPVFEYQISFFLSLITAKKLPKLNSPFLAAIDSTLDLCSEFAKAC